MEIRRAQLSDARAIAEIIVPTFREGSTYTIDPDISEPDALAYWLSPDKEIFVAEADGMILGTYFYASQSARRRSTRLQLRLHNQGWSDGKRDRARDVRTFVRPCALAGLSRYAVQLCRCYQ